MRRTPEITTDQVPEKLVKAFQQIRFPQAHTIGEKFSLLRRALPGLMRMIDNEQTGIWVADYLRELIQYGKEVGEKYQLGAIAHDQSAKLKTEIVGHYAWIETWRGPVATEFSRGIWTTLEPHLSMAEVLSVFGRHGGGKYDVYRALFDVGAEVHRTSSNESVVSMQNVVKAANHYLQQRLDRVRLYAAVKLLREAGIRIDFTTLHFHGMEQGIVVSNENELSISLDNLLAIIPQLVARQKYLYPPEGKPWVSAHKVAAILKVDMVTMQRIIQRHGSNPANPIRSARPPFHDFLVVHPDDARRLMSKVAVYRGEDTLKALRSIGISRGTLDNYLGDMRALGSAIEDLGTDSRSIFVMPQEDLDWLFKIIPQYRRPETRKDFLRRKMKERKG